MKLVINDPKNHKSYQKEIPPEKAGFFYGKKIGDSIDVSTIGLPGYKLEIRGGSDKDGFPMRKDIEGSRRVKVVLSSPPGIRIRRKGERRAKTVVGNTVGQNTVQINANVMEYGEKNLEELGLTLTPKEKKAEEKSKR